MNLDISKMPYSKYGSFISITEDVKGQLTIRNVNRIFDETGVFLLSFKKNGENISYDICAYPYKLMIDSNYGRVRIYIRNKDELVIDSDGPDICLLLFEMRKGFGYRAGDNRYEFIMASSDSFAAIHIQNGIVSDVFEKDLIKNRHMQMITELNITPENEYSKIILKISNVQERILPLEIHSEKEIASVENEWSEFMSKMVHVPEDSIDFAKLLWYNLWSCYIYAGENFKYDSILMSKRRMSGVWSWDHCFNALILSKVDMCTPESVILFPAI